MVAVIDEFRDDSTDGVFRIDIRLVTNGVREVCFGAVAPNCSAVGLGGVLYIFDSLCYNLSDKG